MTKDFIAISAATFVVAAGAWGLRGNTHGTSPETTETVRVLATERSPYMRTER